MIGEGTTGVVHEIQMIYVAEYSEKGEMTTREIGVEIEVDRGLLLEGREVVLLLKIWKASSPSTKETEN